MKYLIFRQHIHKIIGGTIMTKVREIYRCQICGNVVDDWVCPLCGVGKEDFSPVEE